MGDSANTPSAAFSDEGTLLCPSCGYDLRGSTSERCSECGEIIDRALLTTSGFPWAHRRKLGRLRAYVKTVWLVTIGSRKLRYETARPQELADGRAFGRVTASIVALLLLAAGISFVQGESLASAAVQKPGWGQTGLAAWMYDLLVPWWAGATLPPVLPAMLALLGWHLSNAPRRLFHISGASDAYQTRADAIARYTTAPMALLLPMALLILAAMWLEGATLEPGSAIWIARDLGGVMVLMGIVAALQFVAILGPILHVGCWAARIHHAGLISGLASALQLLALWLFGLVVLLGLVPWCIGFTWIVFDSLR